MPKTFLLISSLVLSLTIADPLVASDAQKTSSPPLDSLLQDILAWLPANFDLPTGNSAPAIKFLSKERLATIRYGRVAAGHDRETPPPATSLGQERDVVALYDDKSETVFLPTGWTGATPAEQSVLVHEIVHHLQNVARLKFDCPMAREKLAYLAQDRWLERLGSGLEKEFEMDKFTLLITSACFH
jgi:hypothetical protein